MMRMAMLDGRDEYVKSKDMIKNRIKHFILYVRFQLYSTVLYGNVFDVNLSRALLENCRYIIHSKQKCFVCMYVGNIAT